MGVFGKRWNVVFHVAKTPQPSTATTNSRKLTLRDHVARSDRGFCFTDPDVAQQPQQHQMKN